MNNTKSTTASQIAAGIAGIRVALNNKTEEKGLTFSPDACALPESCSVRVVPLDGSGAYSLYLDPSGDAPLTSLIEKSLPADLRTAPVAGNQGSTPSL